MANASNSSNSGSVAEIKDLLTCSLCSNILLDPRSLTCLHHFCKGCLEKYVERLNGDGTNISSFPCPTCRTESTLESDTHVVGHGMSSSCFITNMLEIMAIQEKAKASATCSRCQDPAINYCATCKVFLCRKCLEAHDSWLIMKNHDVLSLQELDNPKTEVKMRRKLFCVKHEAEMVKYYCETCKELCCIDCVVLHNQKRDHSCMAVRCDSQKREDLLQSRYSILDRKFSEGKEALKDVREALMSLERNANCAKEHMQEQREKILNIVAKKLVEREMKMTEGVNKAYDESSIRLNKRHEEIRNYLDKVQTSVSLSKNLLKRGSIEEILSLQKDIDRNIEKLGDEQPEKLLPVNNGGILYAPGDFSNMNVDEIVRTLGFVEGDSPVMFVLENIIALSSILKEEIAFMQKLHEWLGGKCKWNLCYRASRDGWSAAEFHRHCDNKGPTVVLVKANNCIFGGYTDQNWQGLTGNGTPYRNRSRKMYMINHGNRYCHSTSSFLFSLRNKDNLPPFIANIRQGQEQYAIYCGPSYGPTFGGGHDLYIQDIPQINQSSSSNFGHTYQLPPGYVYGSSEETMNLLAGQPFFHTTEIEVFN